MDEWICPDNCKKLPIYKKDHWGDSAYIIDHNCPDDLMGDEPCPLAIFPEDINDKKGSDIHMNFADMWNKKAKEAKKVIGMPDELPEGTYNTEVLVCKFGETKAGKSMVFWDLKVVDGPQKNNHIHVYRVFSKTEDSEENDKAIDRALDDFKDLELPCDQQSIGKSMTHVIGKVIEIKLVKGTNGNFRNFKRIIEIVSAETTPEIVPTFTAEVVPTVATAVHSFGTTISDEEIPF